MPTTTERTRRRALPVGGIALALVLWFGGMTLAALLIRPEAVVAFGSPSHLLQAAVDTDGQPLNAGRGFVTVRTGSADTVRRLYAEGAWLVWPVLGAGCRGRAGA
ncbi:hypothetical protein [Bradyrhizobium prioriisuperbiae]|uniref:hypothetical protein n=1 Tax=Bradyrhizobium prioriisuperbiae TaxID=2854389 RepID=UPI0028E48B33|nr:hypothetical protein [Bradyrhizobium prioritasuperba]